MRDAHRGVGLVDVLATGAGSAEGVDAQLRGIEHDVADRARLRQYRDRAGGSVDAALSLRLRNALDPVTAGFELELGVGALPDDARDDLLVSPDIPRRLGYHLDLPAL